MLADTYIYILMIFALVLLLRIVQRSTYIDKVTNRYYSCAIVGNMTALAGFAIRICAEAYRIEALSILANMAIYIGSPAIVYCVSLIFLKKTKKNMIIYSLPFAINVILTITSPFTGAFFSVSSDGIYSRGYLYPFFFLEIVGYIIFWVIISAKNFSNYDSKEKRYLFALYLFAFFSYLLQAFNSEIKIGCIGTAMVLLMIYGFFIETSGKYDELTGVKNRKAFYMAVTEIVDDAVYTIVFYDANGLKKANDEQGHDAGDLLIRTIAEAIRMNIGKYGTVYRMGGDEFCAILNLGDDKKVENINHKIEDWLESKSKNEGMEISVSYGYSIHGSTDTRTYSEVMQQADMAMYEFKQNYYKNKNANNE